MSSDIKSEKTAKLKESIYAAFEKEIIKKLVFSRPSESEIMKVSGRLVCHRGRRFISFEYSLPGNTVSHKNVTKEELGSFIDSLLGDYRQANLITTLGEVEWKISSSGKEALLGAEKLERRMHGDAPDFVKAVEALDKKKDYILSGNEDFLKKLGISDKSGRVHDKKQGKFRQINHFLEHIEEIYPKLSSKDEIIVYDLCCGKSYLSFAVYYYLTAIKKKHVKMLGIDLKRDVIDWCQALACEVGFVGMKFVYDDVRNTPGGEIPDMVISLHACDIATDIVIDTAAQLGAEVILSTPCCHRYLSKRINSKPLSFVTEYAHLSNKLCETLTDAIRAARLSAYGYDVTVPELTDPDDTPKNTLIRAVKNRSIGEAELKARRNRYDDILAFLLGESKDEYLKGI